MCLHDQLWRNRGKRRFESVTASAGLHTDEGFCGRGVLWMDVNDDHRLDIVVANYRLDPNLLWLNEGDGQFREAAHDYGVRGNGERGAFGHSIGPAAGDLDNDAVTDLVITNLAHPRFIEFSDQTMVLLRVAGETTVFADVYAQSGIAFDETNADPSLGDVDNDGDLDIVLTSIYAGKGSHLYLNDGEAHFTDVTWLAGARVENGWGNALWDFDRDGDLDLLVASHDGVRLLRNTGLAHHWLAVDITATTCNRQGSGTRITLRQDQRVQVREIGGAKGTGTGIPQAAHFGLGADGAHVDLLLEDTCGGRYLLPDVAIDRHITVELPAAVVRQATPIHLHAQ